MALAAEGVRPEADFPPHFPLSQDFATSALLSDAVDSASVSGSEASTRSTACEPGWPEAAGRPPDRMPMALRSAMAFGGGGGVTAFAFMSAC